MSIEEAKAFAKRIANLFIEHEEVTRVWDRFDSMRTHLKAGTENEDPRHLMVTGLSGVWKTQISKRYVKKNPGFTIYDEKADAEIDIAPVIRVKLPYPFTQMDFYKRIIKALGAPIVRSDARVNYLKDQALHLLVKQRTEMIIFDEMNFIMRTKRFDNQEAMEMFKDLTNEGRVCLVCMGTPQIESLRTMEDEYIGRFGRERISRFENCDEKFQNLLVQIEEILQPPAPIGLGDVKTGLPALLHFYCQGRIRYLHNIIIEAYRLLGVFESDFHDISKSQLNVELIERAKYNLFGEIDHLTEPTLVSN